MEDEIYVFECSRETKDEVIKHLKNLKNPAYYSEHDFTNVSDEDRVRFGGESKIIINTFSRFVVRTIADSKRTGKKPVVLIDDFISRVDEAMDISEYIKPLFEVSGMVIYFAESEKSAKRLRESGLTVGVYKKEI